MAPSILIYGHDTTLLDTRRWVLERSGYRVETAVEGAAAEARIAAQSIDLLLLCHTLSFEERRAVCVTGASLQPGMKRLSFGTISQETGRESEDEETLESFAGATGLIAAVRNLLRRNVAV